jgi:hypothetical protein
MRIPVRTKQWGYWGQDLSGNHYEDTVIAVTPAGEVTETEAMHNSSLFAPRDEGPVAFRRATLWSLGRFFSGHLVKVTRVEESKDGRLVLSATGNKGGQQNGRWELEVEPAAAWMVRKARFYWDSFPDRINVEMRNDGSVWSGPYCIPKEAVINQWGSIDDKRRDRTEKLTFDPAVERFDEQLYATTQQAVAQNKTPTLTLHDYRVSPPSISEPFRPKRTQPLQAQPGNAKKWLIGVNVVAILALLAILVFRRYRRRHGDVLGK